MARTSLISAALIGAFSVNAAEGGSTEGPPAKTLFGPNRPVYQPWDRAVSTWRLQAADHLVLTADQVAAFRDTGLAPRVARCVRLNNYWCIKRAGWNGEIAADGEGHVAFASAVEGAAVAALLLKRYYVDFHRKTALSIISHWAPAQCAPTSSSATTGVPPRAIAKAVAPRGLANTLRARWLSGHSRGFVTPVAGRKTAPRKSVVANRGPRMMSAPTIAAGLGEASRINTPMTLDALLTSSPNAPPSRSMLGMPRRGKAAGAATQLGSVSSCGFDGPRIVAYAEKAASGIVLGKDGDLALFDGDGLPTPNLAAMMMNMARVEIGPLGPKPSLVDAGIAEAFKPGRNPDKS